MPAAPAPSSTDLGVRYVYEPIVDLARDRVVAHEVLTVLPGAPPVADPAWSERLHRPQRVLGHVARHVAGGAPLHVNVSADDLSAGTLPSLIGHLIPRDARHLLTLEVTEHARLCDTAIARESVRRLRAEGVRLAVDDFGEGWSNLRSLQLLRPEVIKVTRAFAVRTGLDRWIVELASALDAELVLEEIETEAHLREAEVAGYGYGQGHRWPGHARTR